MRLIKSLLFLLVTLVFFISCQKENVELKEKYLGEHFINEKLALEIASNLVWDRKISLEADVNRILPAISEIVPVENELQETMFYIINYKGGGFVILSADNRVEPILAYSETNNFNTSFTNLPITLQGWLEGQVADISYVKNNNVEAQIGINDLWTSPSSMLYNNYSIDNKVSPLAEGEGPPSEPCEDYLEFSSVPILSTTWHQFCGFNDLMPTLTCVEKPCYLNLNAHVGCVPLAIAQIMFHHKSPSSYSWSSMLLNSGNTITATLLKDIWDIIPSNKKYFNCDGTYVEADYDISNVFYNFGYSNVSVSNNFSASLVASSSNAGRPVILSGSNGTTSHVWITDAAYRYLQLVQNCPSAQFIAYEYFHMRWGWYNGQSDGWYKKGSFNPNNSYNQYPESYYITP